MTAKEKMNTNRKTAIIVGVLFIIATVSAIISGVFFESIYDPDYLTAVSANENQLLIGVLLVLTLTASVVGIAFMMFPILKKHNESLALGYVGARIFEGFFFAVWAIGLLLLLSLSQEFVKAGAPAASYFQTSGALLLAVVDWSIILLVLPLGLGALMFYYLLYQSKLIPRWLSGWGLIGATMILAAYLLSMFGLSPTSTIYGLLAVPIAVNEMVLAIWLIVKGFNPSAIESESVKTDIN